MELIWENALCGQLWEVQGVQAGSCHLWTSGCSSAQVQTPGELPPLSLLCEPGPGGLQMICIPLTIVYPEGHQ